MRTIAEIRRVVSELAERYGAERVYLFGSYARGDAHEDSDVDLRVNTDKTWGLFKFAGLLCDLEDAFGCHVDLVSTRALDNEFRREITPEEVLLYEQARADAPQD